MIDDEERVHNLKTWPEPFQAIWDGVKPFELRLNDRNYQVGDRLNLREFIPEPPEKFITSSPHGEYHAGYTGRRIEAMVTFVLEGHIAEKFGLKPGYCILGIRRLWYYDDKHSPAWMQAAEEGHHPACKHDPVSGWECSPECDKRRREAVDRPLPVRNEFIVNRGIPDWRLRGEEPKSPCVDEPTDPQAEEPSTDE